MITVAILTHNDEKTIESCLQSVLWADEILVVDDNSADKTKEILQSFQKKHSKIEIFDRSLQGNFSAQRNFLLEKATNDWIFFVDPDEMVTKSLATEIGEKTQKMQRTNGFFLKRNDLFFGKNLHFGETATIQILRLARKGKGLWTRNVHEFWEVDGRVMQLQNPLIHHPHPTVSEFIKDINFYTTIDAAQMIKFDHKHFSYFRTLANPLGKFFQNFFLRLGIFDGMAGFVMAFMMSFHSLLVRVKMYEAEKHH